MATETVVGGQDGNEDGGCIQTTVDKITEDKMATQTVVGGQDGDGDGGRRTRWRRRRPDGGGRGFGYGGNGDCALCHDGGERNRTRLIVPT
ncbi:hypothetical protein AALP_AA7G225700 [Arabis alpina]|uniref:Uncharacterized protein n=1 Tax=Arabis alpina TaxID=50452 RepID=A0A087GJW4_ARAAL|nr:hypothetical protein AALP_AA7G225700 [Arabis alpina]